MNDKQAKLCQEKLAEALQEIEKSLSKSEVAAEAVSPDKSLGRPSRVEAMQDQQLILEVRRRHKKRKLEIINAMSRLEQDKFGKCSFCGADISEERLDVFPEVETCIRCA